MKTKFRIVRFVSTVLFLGIMPFSTFAFEYTINFAASGESAVYDSIIVQNLTKGTSVTILQGGVLTLYDVVSTVDRVNTEDKSLRVFPNPVTDKSTVRFYARSAGNARISAFGTDGKKIIEANENVQAGYHSFQLSLPNGVYLIQVKGAGYSHTAKVVSQAGNIIIPKITYSEMPQPKTMPQKIKNIAGTMLYSPGDQLLYKGISGNSCTVTTDVPTGSKTVNMEFVVCRDGSGNYYSTVKIGTQVWMAENLNTTKYLNGDDIVYLSDGNDWKYAYSGAMCNNYNNVDYGSRYGKLYNWYAVNDSRKLAPTGWHVATHDEWTALKVHVDTHWGAFANVAKALAADTDWKNSLVEGAVGNNLYGNNYTGFTALPGGDRGGTNGTFFNILEGAFWWTSSEYNISNAWYWYFDNNALYIVWDNSRKQFGLSVRCVKD